MVLASGEQLRFASEDELLAAHYVPHFAVERGSDRGARNYVDVRNQLLPASQLLGGENITLLTMASLIFGKLMLMAELFGYTMWHDASFSLLRILAALSSWINCKITEDRKWSTVLR